MPKDAATFTIHAAKTHLSQLIARVEAGEEVIIARGDKPVAKLTAVDKPKPKRVFGSMAHLVGELGPEFFEPLPPEELAAWEGGRADDFDSASPEASNKTK